jgi:hypothetical protein
MTQNFQIVEWFFTEWKGGGVGSGEWELGSGKWELGIREWEVGRRGKKKPGCWPGFSLMRFC